MNLSSPVGATTSKLPNIKQPCVIDASATFGANCIVWHFTSIGFMAQIGDNVSIGGRCFIGNWTVIGSETRINDNVFIPNQSSIGSRVFIGPHVVFTDDRYPRVNNHDYTAEPPILEDDCSIGAGAVILPGVKIGRGATVGAGTVVTKNVPAGCTVVGNPSVIITQSQETL